MPYPVRFFHVCHAPTLGQLWRYGALDAVASEDPAALVVGVPSAQVSDALARLEKGGDIRYRFVMDMSGLD